MPWDPSQPWPGTAGGASSPYWGGYVRLFVRASIVAGNPFHVGEHEHDALDAGNVLASGLALERELPGRLWADLSCDTVEVQTAAGGESNGIVTTTDAGTCQITLSDPEGKYDPTNPASPYQFGGRSRLVPGVPVEVWAEIVDPATGGPNVLRLSGQPGDYVSAPHTAALNAAGDIQVTVSVPAGFTWDTGPWGTFASMWTDASAVQQSWILLKAPPACYAFYSINGGDLNSALSPAVPVGTRRFRWHRAAATGLHTFVASASSTGNADWVTLGQVAGPAGPLYPATANLAIGSDRAEGQSTMLAGDLEAVEVSSGSTGGSTVYASPNFAAQPGGTRTFTDAQGNPWALHGNAVIGSSTPAAVTVRYLFTGTADSWGEPWSPHPSSRRATLLATDATKTWARFERPEQPAVGLGDNTFQRVNRLVQFYGWAGTVDPGTSSAVTFAATTLPASGWELLSRTLADEIGTVYFTPDGALRWTSRADWFADPPPVLELGCRSVDTELHDVITDASPSNSDATMRNVVRAQREGGALQTAQSLDSIEQFGPYEYQRTDLGVLTDPEAGQWATDVLSVSAFPRLVLDDVTLVPAVSHRSWDLWPDLLAVRLVTDPVRIVWAPPDRPDAIVSTVARVIGVEHQITRARWEVTLQLAVADLYAAAPSHVFTLGPHAQDALDAGNVLALTAGLELAA